MTMLNDTQTTIDRPSLTITFRRTFAAPREDVFDAWTKPEQIRCWWDPTGVPLAECAIDLRPGGAFHFSNKESAHGPPFSGVYQVVERPSLLVFEALGAVGTVKLETQRSMTHMMVTIRCGSPEHLETFLKIGVDVNTDRTFDQLVAYMKRTKA